jgi:hypothetical protein
MGASYSHRSSGLHPEVGARRCRCSCSSSTQLLSAGGLIKFACRPLVKTRSQRPWRRAWLQRLILSLPNFFHPPPALPRPPPGARGLRATALVIGDNFGGHEHEDPHGCQTFQVIPAHVLLSRLGSRCGRTPPLYSHPRVPMQVVDAHQPASL